MTMTSSSNYLIVKVHECNVHEALSLLVVLLFLYSCCPCVIAGYLVESFLPTILVTGDLHRLPICINSLLVLYENSLLQCVMFRIRVVCALEVSPLSPSVV